MDLSSLLDFIGGYKYDSGYCCYSIHYYADNGKIIPYPAEGFVSDCTLMIVCYPLEDGKYL